MSVTLLHQAEAKLEEIVTQYQLTRYFDTGGFSTTRDLFLVATADNTLHIWDHSHPDRPRVLINFQQGREKDLIYALTALKTNAGPRLAVGTRSGRLYLLDGSATVLWETKVADASIWHVTSAEIDGQVLLFVCVMDRTIRIFDLGGRLRCTVRTPGKLLSLDVRASGGQMLLAGGTQERNWIYVWELEEMLKRQTGMPSYVLTGGEKPAFCTKFVELAGEAFLAHSNWDGRAYLYRLETLRRRAQNPPSLILEGNSPLYTVEAVEIEGQPIVLAGSAFGHIYAWDVHGASAGPRHLIASLSARIRAMQIAKIQGQVKLFAGGNSARLYIFDLDRLHDGMAPAQILLTQGVDVTGIEIFQDLR